MSRVLIKACAAAAGLLFAALVASAQDNGTYSGYSPYSVYGTGILHQGGTAYNRSMGGVGIAGRNNRFVYHFTDTLVGLVATAILAF